MPAITAAPELDSKFTTTTHRRWCAAALAAREQRDPAVLIQMLAQLQRQHQQAGLQQLEDHPAFVVLVAQLAELAGIDMHWPAAHERRAQLFAQR